MTQQVEFRLNIKGPDRSWTFVIPIGKTTIGRQSGNNLILADQQVSREHAQIQCSGEVCEISDLGSANGTRLNGKKLVSHIPVPLTHNDKIKIGGFELIVERILAQRSTSSLHSKTESITKEPQVSEKLKPKIGQPATPPPPVPPPSQPLSPPSLPSFDPSQPPPGLSFRSERLMGYLPDIYRSQDSTNEFLSSFLAIFEAILFPIEWQIDNFDIFLDPVTAPAEFLPWLANWFETGFDMTWSEVQCRLLLKEVSKLYARHGTCWALSRILEIYTDHTPLIDDLADDLPPNTFRVKLDIQENAEKRKQIEHLIDAHKPVHTAYILELKG